MSELTITASLADKGRDTRFQGQVQPPPGTAAGQVLTADGVGGSSWAAGGGGGAGSDGWTDDTSETWTRASATTFTVPTDLTAKYTTGTRIKLTQSATVKFFVIVSSVFAAGTTTVTVTAGTDFTLTAVAISANFHSYQANPQGWPARFKYTPTLTGYSGSPSSFATFTVIARVCFVDYFLSGTSNAGTLTMSLPIAMGFTDYSTENISGVSIDNGTTQNLPSRLNIISLATSANFFKSPDGSGWTAVGTKSVQGEFWYSI